MKRSLHRAALTALALTAVGCGASEVPAAALSESVARVLCKDRAGKTISTGSGFMVSDRKLVTNEHVIEGCAELEAVFDEDTSIEATVVASDASTDLAILELERAAGRPALLLDVEELAPSTPIVAVGFPGINDFAAGQELEKPSHITGVVVNDTEQTKPRRRILLISATIGPGNSGGPVFDRCGRVVGVVTFFATDKKSGAKSWAAVHVRELLSFAKENGVTVGREARACEPGHSPLAVGVAGVSLAVGVTALAVTLRKPVMRALDEQRDTRTRGGSGRAVPRAAVGPPLVGAPHAALIGLSGPFTNQAVPLDAEGVTVGRDPSICNLIFHQETPEVSRRHAQVRVGPVGRVEVRDCWSSKGTRIGGRAIAPGAWVATSNGDIVEFGGPNARFRVQA